MAAAHAVQHYPPSPPPSPSPPSIRRRHKNKKKPDPFEQLAATPLPSGPSSPPDSPSDDDDDAEPLLTRVILTPLLFTSFVLSLFLVNYRNRVRRAQAHASDNNTKSSLLSYYLLPSRWLDPEPYQDPSDATWGQRQVAEPPPPPADARRQEESGAEAHGEEEKKERQGSKKRNSWHLHKKIRKVARLEVGDALEMRGRVILAMTVVLMLACVAACMGIKWFFIFVSRALFGSSQA